jgi:hypothetical protein
MRQGLLFVCALAPVASLATVPGAAADVIPRATATLHGCADPGAVVGTALFVEPDLSWPDRSVAACAGGGRVACGVIEPAN